MTARRWCLGAVVLAGLACGGGPPPTAGTPAPAGPARDGKAQQLLAVHLPGPDPEALALWRAEVLATWPDLPQTVGEPTEGDGVAFFEPTIEEFAPIDVEQLGFFGHGFDDDGARAFAASRGVILAAFQVPAQDAHRMLKVADASALAVAEARGGWLWDEDARLAYTPAAFREERLGGWDGETPIVSRQVAQHLYDDGGYLRLVTLGMGKLGLPDLVVEGLLPRHGELVGYTVQALGQGLAEGVEVGPDGSLEVALATLRSPDLRELGQAAMAEGGDGVVRVRAGMGTVRDGDADNRLWQLDFGESDARDRFSATERELARTFGGLLTPNEKLLADPGQTAELERFAVEARAELVTLLDSGRGLAVGGRLSVKAPFETSAGGVEWIWVAVFERDGDVLRGRLSNEPFDVPGLVLGDPVTVRLSEIGDYHFVDADGTVSGGRSEEVLRRR